MRIALLDADRFAYSVGFASEGAEEAHACARLRNAVLDAAFRFAGCEVYEGFLTPRGKQFRHDIATLQPYKGHRSQSKPTHWQALRDFMTQVLGFGTTTFQEADDAIGIRATELEAAGRDFVIVSSDKDLDTIPGAHCDPVKRDNYLVTPAEATLNHYRQMLTGDKVDNIPGLFFVTGIRCGPETAAKLLPGPMPEALMWEIVCDAFGNVEAATEIARLTYIRRAAGHIWQPPAPYQGAV